MTNRPVTHCNHCGEPVQIRYEQRHQEDCEHGNGDSDIGVVDDPTAEEESTRTNKHGERIGKRTNPDCSVCGQDISQQDYKAHVVECSRQPEPSNIGVVGE